MSVVSVGAASLTLGLVYSWGQVVPSWVPWVAGRIIPTVPVVAAATAGGLLVTAIGISTALNWDTISSFQGSPTPAGYALATAAYAPALLWGPLLLVVTGAYWTRRRRSLTLAKSRCSSPSGPC